MAEIAVNIYDKAKININDIADSFSVYESERVWAEMLIRGLHPDYDFFYPELYAKYFIQVRSVIMFKKPVRTYIQFPEKPSRQLNTESKKVVFYDKQIVEFKTPLQLGVYKDVMKYFKNIKHVSGNPLVKTFPFGNLDLKKNFIVFIPDKSFSNMREIKGLRENKFKINLNEHKDDLWINGKVSDFKNKKIDYGLKDYFDKFSNSTDMMELVLNPDIKIPSLFIPVTKRILNGNSCQ